MFLFIELAEQIGRVEEGRISGSIGAAERAGDTSREGHPSRDAATLFGRRLSVVRVFETASGLN
jgi:hypothetical protein